MTILTYEYAEWLKARAGFNYQVEVEEHSSSVPFQRLRDKLDIRLSATTSEAFRKGERVAAERALK